MTQPVHSCMTKAIIADGNQLETGPQWITSRRARLRLFDDHLVCGDWTVHYEDIREAVLASFRSPILRIPGYVLSARTDDHTYHFGLNGWRYWKGDLPFPVKRANTRLRMSWLSMVARAILIGYVAYAVWRWAT
ncbi:hypothetical protein RISK_004037 [Rhodopirellula islandica]|uniref:Transmembrane protein n=1 Tax=Rhodopirellula islandica TaxID=595434 RepID=A0A0J1BA61_RHOIS|nr:hypothetical protein [Rhodopirellula islandica]KLU03610.1 hypothetical protein RISK_004347 [Rhodopirellula islandica]KLU03630.1 hypothetical protein RISK_004037 [Rhodopirellula islandica]